MKQHLKRLHHSLNFYSENQREKIIGVNGFKIKDEGFFRNNVPEQIENILYSEKYISDNPNECLDPLFMITLDGDKYLEKLDYRYHTDWRFWLAIITLVIVILSFILNHNSNIEMINILKNMTLK